MKKPLAFLLGMLSCLAACSSGRQGTAELRSIEGMAVDSSSRVVPGAMVTVQRTGGGVAVTVFADEKGRYRVTNVKAARYYVEAQTDGRHSAAEIVDVTQSSAKHNPTLRDQPYLSISGAQAISGIPDNLEKRRLVQNCVMCHAIGTSDTAFAGAKDATFWEGAIHRMETEHEAYLSPDFNHKRQAALLAKYIPSDPAKAPPPATQLLTNVMVYEYDLPLPNMYPHDIGVDSQSRIWVADYINNYLEVFDPATEEWKTYPYPIKDAGAHSVIEGPDGNIWLVLNKSNHIASFNPGTEKFTLYPVPDPGKMPIGPRPHTHMFDSKGKLWYTEIAGNRVSRLDPKTGEITVFNLPEQPQLFEDSFWLWPYGLTIDSLDNVYYTKLGGNRVGRIDAATGEITEYEMPVPYSGPRRLDVDSNDILWVPAFTTGKLYRLDPRTREFKEYQIPSTNSAPYAVYVDKEKKLVWICEAAANRIGIFDIASETFSEILLPSQVGYTRKIDLDKKTGIIWTSYSQMPAKNNKVVAIKVVTKDQARARALPGVSP